MLEIGHFTLDAYTPESSMPIEDCLDSTCEFGHGVDALTDQSFGHGRFHLSAQGPPLRSIFGLGSHLPHHVTEDTVDKPSRVGFAVRLGEIHCFVDRDARRNVILIENLVEGNAKDVSIRVCHALDRPVPCMLVNQTIDFSEMAERSLDQRASKGRLAFG